MFDELDRLIASSVSEMADVSPALELQDGERRIVSILFADVSGFTSLSEKLDPEQIRLIMDRLFQLFTICIKNYGGYIDKYEGDLVMALFGAKVASEKDTERCLRAALEMLDKLALFNEILHRSSIDKDLKLDLRIGINTGLVTTGKVGEKREGDFTVYGDAVNMASRMEEYAPLNSIMVPKEVKEIAADTFDFKDNGSLEIKGKSKPVEVFILTGLKRTDFLEREAWKFPFLGRTGELCLLADRYLGLSRKVSGDTGQSVKPELIAIQGSAGMGKTRLISEFIGQNIDTSNRGCILHASVPAFAQTPYCLFTNILNSFIGLKKSDSLDDIRSGFEEFITALKPKVSDECAVRLENAKPVIGYLLGLNYNDARLQQDPRILKDHIMLSIRHFIEAAAESENRIGLPLTVILEDLHWVDEASSSMIDFLLKTLNIENSRDGLETCKILFLLSYRNEFQLPDSWRSISYFSEIALKPLTDEECETLLKESIKDIDIIFDRKRELLDKAEGNPFYLEEWIKLLASPSIRREDVRTLPVPDSLTALMLSRIDRLEKNVRLLLQKASVNGMDFSTEVLEYIEKQLNRFQKIDEQLMQLNSSGFVNTLKEHTYSFNHAITRDVSYNTLLIANRRILHRLIGEFLEMEYSDRLSEVYPALAYHFRQSDETDKAIKYLNNAVELAEKNFDTRSAIDFYDSLCSIYDELIKTASEESIREYTVALIGHLINKSRLLEPIGRWDECQELYEKAFKLGKSIGDEHLATRARSNQGTILWRKGKIEQALEIINESIRVLEEMGDEENITRAVLNMGNIYLMQGKYDSAIECYDRVVSFFEKVKRNEHFVALYTGNKGIAYMYKSMFPEAEACYSKQLQICEKLGDRHGIATVTNNLGELYRNMSNPGKAMEYFNRSYRSFEELGDINRCGCITGNIGVIQYTRGDFEAALESYSEAIGILKRTGDRFHQVLYSGNTGITYLHMKDHETAERWFADAIAESEVMKSDHLLSYWLSYRAENYFSMGKFTLADESNKKAEDIARKIGNTTILCSCMILDKKLKFERLEDNTQRIKECIDPLLRMLDETEETHDRAFIHYALTGMLARLESYEESRKHRKTTIDVCRKLYLEEEYFQWKAIIDELEEKYPD